MLIALLQSVCAFAQTDWVRLAPVKHLAVKALINDHLVCLSDNGDVLLLDSEQDHWKKTSLPQNVVPYSMDFLDPLHGIIVGDSGIVYSTTDGGKSWSYTPFVSNEKLICVKYLNADTVLIGSSIGNMYRTQNGGNTWGITIQKINVSFNDIQQIGSSKSILVTLSSNGIIMRSTDNGTSWDSVFSTPAISLASCTSSGEVAIATGKEGTVLLSTNNGLTWTKVFSDSSFDLYSSLSLSDSSIIAVGSKGYVVLSNDRGSTWTKYQVNDTTLSTTFHSLTKDEDKIIMVGDNSAIFSSSDSGKSWGTVSHMPFPLSSVSSSAFGESYHYNDSIWYFLTGEGGIYKTTNAGITWHVSFCIQSYTDIAGMKMWDRDNGFIIGAINGIYETTSDGGQTWNLLSSEKHQFGYHGLKDLQFVSDSVGFILSDSLLWKTSGKANNWDSMRISLLYPWSLSFIDSNLGFMCGSVKLSKTGVSGQGGIYRTTNGGADTKLVFSKDSVVFYGIKMVDKMVGYACADKGCIVKTSDGGDTWVELATNINQRLLDINFINDSVGIAVGDGYTVVTTYDGGLHWSLTDFSAFYPGKPKIYGFSGVSLIDSERVCITGAEKAIFIKKLLPRPSTSFIPTNVPYNPFLEILVYPTPSIDKVTIRLRGLFSIHNEHVVLSLYDFIGRKVKTIFEGVLPEYTDSSVDIVSSIDDVPSGVYYVHLLSESSACVGKVIVNK